jgi:hypothetical protein
MLRLQNPSDGTASERGCKKVPMIHHSLNVTAISVATQTPIRTNTIECGDDRLVVTLRQPPRLGIFAQQVGNGHSEDREATWPTAPRLSAGPRQISNRVGFRIHNLEEQRK